MDLTIKEIMDFEKAVVNRLTAAGGPSTTMAAEQEYFHARKELEKRCIVPRVGRESPVPEEIVAFQRGVLFGLAHLPGISEGVKDILHATADNMQCLFVGYRT